MNLPSTSSVMFVEPEPPPVSRIDMLHRYSPVSSLEMLYSRIEAAPGVLAMNSTRPRILDVVHPVP